MAAGGTSWASGLKSMLRGGSAPGPVSKEAAISSPSDEIVRFCRDIDKQMEAFKWGISACKAGVTYKIGGKSVRARPLIYAEFGNPKSSNRTLILSMVHGDEITPLYLALQVLELLAKDYPEKSDFRVIVAPLVNPDSFFRKPRTRVNANGVDVNRNFATEDWEAKALTAWKGRFKSNPRRFPGQRPDSEPETMFQKHLIDQYKPDKIISIHAPLNVMDYDGPNQLTLAGFPKEYSEQINKLKTKIGAKSTGYFPGSLGNYAGNNRAIPTFTLELPSSNPKLAETYWKKFQSGIKAVIEHPLP